MPQKSDPPLEQFAEFLAWLDPNPELAALIYIEIRDSIVRIFGWRHCADPEGMADEVFDRASRKAAELRKTFQGDPKLFCYGVANNLIREYQKKIKSFVRIEDVDIAADLPDEVAAETDELREECLSLCLQELSEEKRLLILSYYAKEKRAKTIHRAELARELGISIEALRVRVLRIRLILEVCIKRCFDQAQAQRKSE
jgi:RNA polymerase sigma factor (sigma-70 family)